MDEPTLVAAAKRGDRDAFNQLVAHYQSLAYNIAYRILGDRDAAADATQDAFLSAYRGIGRFRGGSFRSWLLRIVTNACYDQLRVKKRRPSTSLEESPDLEREEWNVDDAEPPEAYVVRQELGRVIQRAIDALPPDQRVVVILSDIQGLHYDEIAEVTRVAIGTVKSRLNRGRRKVRDYLMEHMELLPARYRLYDKAGGVGGLASLFAVGCAEGLLFRWLGRGKHGDE